MAFTALKGQQTAVFMENILFIEVNNIILYLLALINEVNWLNFDWLNTLFQLCGLYSSCFPNWIYLIRFSDNIRQVTFNFDLLKLGPNYQIDDLLKIKVPLIVFPMIHNINVCSVGVFKSHILASRLQTSIKFADSILLN